MLSFPNVGLLPNGHDVAWFALGLLLIACIAKLWRARNNLGRAVPGDGQGLRGNHQDSRPWLVALAQRLYWVASLLVLVCLLASLRLPLSIVESLGPATETPLTLRWGDFIVANPACGVPKVSAVASSQFANNTTASHHQLCKVPKGLQRDLSRYQEDLQQAPTVYENGLGFWGLRSSTALVREQGLGRFHLSAPPDTASTTNSATLWYSASDGSDPSSNTRRYQLQYPVSLSIWLQLAGWLFCLPLLMSMLRRVLGSLAGGSALQQEASLGFQTVIFGLLVLLCLGPLWQIWAEAGSRFAIAGILPWSDGSAWFNGLNHLLNFNELESWTVRRPLNPVFLAGLFHLTGLDWPLTLIARALLLALSFAFLCRVLMHQFGALPMLAAIALASAFAADFIPVALTEPQGLIFAAAGFAWLILGASKQRLGCYALGVTLVSLALSLRLGPVGLLGAFVLWPLFGVSKMQRWRWVWIATLAVLVGLAPTWLWTTLFYPGENLPGANFAYTFYGLAFGGAPWTLFAEHHPQLANLPDSAVTSLVWQQALTQVRADPALLLQGFEAFLTNYFRYFFVFLEQPIQRFMSLLFALGIASCCINAFGKSSQPLARLALLSWLGVLGTVPLIYWSLDAYRAFAVSLPLDMLLVAAGVQAMLKLPQLRWQMSDQNNTPQLQGWSVFSGVLLLLLSLIPLWAMQQQQPPATQPVSTAPVSTNPAELQVSDSPTTAADACSNGQRRLLLDLGHSSPFIRLSASPTTRTWLTDVNYQQFRYDPSFYHNEIAAQLLALKPGDTLIHGFDFAAYGSGSDTQIWVALPYGLRLNSSAPPNGLHQICAVPFDSNASSARYRVYRALSWAKVS